MPSRIVIEDFLAQHRIAFVGASREPKQFANSVYRHLRDGGRELVPIHREAPTVDGDRAYVSVRDLPQPVDGLVVMLPPGPALDVVLEAIDAGVPRIWLHRGAGQGAVSSEAVEACHRAGVAVVDGACPMMFATPVGFVHQLHRVISGRRIAA
jgi:predicted CoA-binding protein